MCGIFGYIGTGGNSIPLVFSGLKSLEYRGYDSWGLAAKKKNRFIIEKHTGKIGSSRLNKSFDALSSSIVIAHTRWATHGGVFVRNAHPHTDCSKKIVVVHNGIIENFEILRKDLLKKGHKFASDTDTEVMAHLVEEYLKHEGFASSVRDAFIKLEGLNAFVIANALSSEVIAVKNGSPLIIGVGDKEFFIASDTQVISTHTSKVLFMTDNTMAILGRELKLVNLPAGEAAEYSFSIIKKNNKEDNKEGFSDYMLKEIYEQPEIVKNIANKFSTRINILTRIIDQSKGSFFIGAGSAFYAGLAASYLFSKIAKKHVNAVLASEFSYLEDFLTNKSLIIALSQSGETIDVVDSLNLAKNKGSNLACITNVLGSTVFRMSDYTLLLDAGAEKAVASTKSYVAKLAVILMLAFAQIKKLGDAKTILLDTSSEITRLFDKKSISNIKKIVDVLLAKNFLYVLGRGVSYPSSLEAALKLKEVAGIHTEGLAGGELKHGSIALIKKSTPCVIFAPNDETYNAIISNAIEIKSRGGLIIGISPTNSSAFDYFIQVKDTKEGSYISQIVPIQLLAYYLAKQKHLDPDKPRNLAKSVTVR